MLKYDFKNNNAVVDLPSIWKIGDGKITITTASGTDAGNIPSNGVFTIQVGNVDPIRAGGTEHYGYDKNIIEVGYTSGSLSAEDRLLVDSSSVILCQYAGENSWCRCEKSLNGLLYTALEENPTDEPRYAYFKHRTISNFTKDGDPVLSEWWVTVMQEANPDPKPQSQNTTEDTPVTPDTPSENGIKVSLNVNNTTTSSVTISSTITIVLANPDRNGEEHGWSGAYNAISIKLSNSSTVEIGAGQSKKFEVTADIDGRNPASQLAIASSLGKYSKNILLYVNGYSDIVTCNPLSTDIVFENNGIYNIDITGNTSGTQSTPQTGSDVSTTITIINNSGSTKTFDGRVCFITYGTYNGYSGYFRFKGNCTEGSNLTIPAGSNRTYTVIFKKDNNQTPSVAIGMHFASQAQRAQYLSNNGYYVNGNCYTCSDFSTNDTFRAGGIYTMTIPSNTHEWSSAPSSNNSSNTNTQSDVNTLSSDLLKVNIIIKNNTGRTIQSTGEIRLYVGNRVGINAYPSDANINAQGLPGTRTYTFSTSNETVLPGVPCTVNGSDSPARNYSGQNLTGEVAVYNHLHEKSGSSYAGFNAVFDTTDARHDTSLKDGGIYVIKLINL